MATSTATTKKPAAKKKATAKKSYKSRSNAPKKDIHQEITDNIISLIEQGKTNNGQLWDNAAAAAAFMPTNARTGNVYNGTNRLSLGLATMVRGYEENLWVTYKQAQACGWQVREGEKGMLIWYAGAITVNDAENSNSTDDDKEKKIPFKKRSHVYNVAQLDGYTPAEKPQRVLTTAENCEIIQTILANTDVDMRPERGDEAFYSPHYDAVQMPPKASFTSNNAYYSVLAHELVHSTKHNKRLGRGEQYTNLYKVEKERYAREELVAELGAAFLGSEIGYLSEQLEFHASYIDSWLSVLRKDPKAIFKACADAQKASDFILVHWAKIEKSTFKKDADYQEAEQAA